MAGGQIKITPQELEGISQKFKSEKAQCEQIINGLKQKIHGLQGQWEGNTKEKFFNEFTNAQKNMTSFLQNLDVIAQELSKIATRFKQTDGQ